MPDYCIQCLDDKQSLHIRVIWNRTLPVSIGMEQGGTAGGPT
jgi:hypothetical protein